VVSSSSSCLCIPLLTVILCSVLCMLVLLLCSYCSYDYACRSLALLVPGSHSRHGYFLSSPVLSWFCLPVPLSSSYVPVSSYVYVIIIILRARDSSSPLSLDVSYRMEVLLVLSCHLLASSVCLPVSELVPRLDCRHCYLFLSPSVSRSAR